MDKKRNIDAKLFAPCCCYSGTLLGDGKSNIKWQLSTSVEFNCARDRTRSRGKRGAERIILVHSNNLLVNDYERFFKVVHQLFVILSNFHNFPYFTALTCKPTIRTWKCSRATKKLSTSIQLTAIFLTSWVRSLQSKFSRPR